MFSRLWLDVGTERPAATPAHDRLVVAKRVLSASRRVCGSCPGFAPPGREFSRVSLLSVEGGFDDVRDVLSGRCSRITKRAADGEYDEIEIPPVKPHVVRHRRFACQCARCGAEVEASAPAVATRMPFGPRIYALAI